MINFKLFNITLQVVVKLSPIKLQFIGIELSPIKLQFIGMELLIEVILPFHISTSSILFMN